MYSSQEQSQVQQALKSVSYIADSHQLQFVGMPWKQNSQYRQILAVRLVKIDQA